MTNRIAQPPPNMSIVQVIHRQQITSDAVSLFLVQYGTRRPPAGYHPGQFVTLAIPAPTEMLYRSYSLCGAGKANEPWEITVKRVHKGLISNYLCDRVPVGSTLYVSMPRGIFTLPAPLRHDVPLGFVAAGSGITPLRGMLRAIALHPPHQRPPVQLYYASASPEDIIYREELAQLDPGHHWLRQWYFLSSRGQRLTAGAVLDNAGPRLRQTHWYICGPDALREDLQRSLSQQGVPPHQIHVEVFATQRPARNVAMSAHGQAIAQMTIQETQARLTVQTGETILSALERQGYHPDYSCRSGTCGACRLRLLAGRVEQSGAVALTHQERAAGYVLSCVATPRGDITLLSGGRPSSRRLSVMSRTVSRSLIRIGSTLAVATLLLGTWQLTNHRPLNWSVTAAPPASTTQLPGSGGTGPSETPTPVLGSSPGPVVTATPVPPPPQPTVVTGTSGHIVRPKSLP